MREAAFAEGRDPEEVAARTPERATVVVRELNIVHGDVNARR